MTDETQRTLRDLLRERHERGAAVAGGRLRPDGEGGLAYDRYEPPARRRWSDGRQIPPETPSIFDRPAPDSTEGDPR